MKVIGLTGGPGMGKSTVEGILRERNLRVIDTDSLARELVAPGQPALQEVVSTFGSGVLSASGQLDRRALGERVFRDPKSRTQLESILHPRIRAAWKNQLEVWHSERAPTAFVVIPLLFETRAEAEFNEIVCVACGESSQRRRLGQRGWTPEHVEQRIAAQLPIEHKMTRSTFVIWTEGPLCVTAAQVERILRDL